MRVDKLLHPREHPVDLGLGRAPGSDRATAVALQRDRRYRMPDDFPSQLAELLGYGSGESSHLLADYRRITRRARGVVNRVFWGQAQ